MTAKRVAVALDRLMQEQSRPGIYGFVVSGDGRAIVASMRAGGYRAVLVIVDERRASASLGPELTLDEVREFMDHRPG